MNPVSTLTATKLPIDQDAWLLHGFDKLEVIRLHLGQGESMEKHINDWHIVFFILSGKGTLDVEGQVFELEEQQSIAVEAGREHCWSNRGDRILELLVIKSKDNE